MENQGEGQIKVLMHKNIEVLEVLVDEDDGDIIRVLSIKEISHIPIGIELVKKQSHFSISTKSFRKWWHKRAIPASREGIEEILDFLELSSQDQLVQKSFGLSLSDHYWMKNKGQDLKWEDINFFQNDFSEDMGELLFDNYHGSKGSINLMSPDNTTDGVLDKRWKIIGGKRCLIKGGTGTVPQQPVNEVIASRLMEKLGIHHINYRLLKTKNNLYCVCENFLTENTELVSAYYFLKTLKQGNHISKFEHLKNVCQHFAIEEAMEEVQKMIVIDYIIANSDRHEGNYGFVRDANTLEWIGFAPIFDSGNSLWHNERRIGAASNSRAFRKTHEAELELVTNLDWFMPEKLVGFKEEVEEIFSEAGFFTASEAKQIAMHVEKRINRVAELKKEKGS